MRLLVSVILVASFAVATFTCALSAQTPEQEFTAARKIVVAHSSDSFFHDGSPEAVAAVDRMWAAAAAFVIDLQTKNPNILPSQLNHALCMLTIEPAPGGAVQEAPEQICEEERMAAAVVDLGDGLLLISPSVGESGTVMLIGPRTGKQTMLWSINHASDQQLDSKHVIKAWRPDNGSEPKDATHFPGYGPLYASVGKLPNDGKGRKRFDVDAGYAQPMGATIGKQTTIWDWNGTSAELLWVEVYSFMIDQGIGTSYDQDSGILNIGQKGEFRTMDQCGSCIQRTLERRVMLTKAGVEDLGVQSMVPEMDAIDELIWRAYNHKSTSTIASPQAVSTLRQLAGGQEGVGMVSDVVRHTATGAEVCLEADELGTAKFTMRRTEDGGYFISRIEKLGDNECPSPAF